MDKFFHWVKSNRFVSLIAVIIVLLLTFGAGMSVGYHRALFASEWGRNYYNNFYGNGHMSAPIMGFSDKGFIGMHGTVGTIIDISSSTISIKGQDNVEKSIVIDNDEVVRKGGNNIPISDLKVGDSIAVIGAPNANGQIESKFIRVFPSQSASQQNLQTK